MSKPVTHPIIEGNRALADEDVVARVLAGETALFELIMRRHNQLLFRVARGVLKSDADAEDVVQQAYLQAYAHLAQFSGDARLSTWLTRITLNEAFARTRRRGRHAEVPFENSESEPMRLMSDRRSPEDDASAREVTRLLEAAVDELPEIYRIVFVMREVQELSTAETAQCLELTEEAVKVRLHRARGLLREAMAARMEARAPEAFAFLGARCDRIVATVLSRLGDAAAPQE
jgi:RNA polymerase sigma-70 factor (ECF subfamily)